MAAKPITRAAHATIRKAGGEAFVFAQVAEGKTLKSIAEELGITRPILSAWCNAAPRKDAYIHARRAAADTLVEQGLEIADSARDPTEVPAAKLQADYRRWMAGKIDRESWGDQHGALVNIDLGQLHLEALRAANRRNREGG